MNCLIYIFVFMLLSCVGSFIGLCSYRIQRGEQIWGGRSHCDKCGKKLRAFELIPIISFFLLGGKCSGCKMRISMESTVIEIVSALLGTSCLLMYGVTLRGFAYCIVTCILIEIAVLDFKTMEISDIAVALIGVIGIVLMIQSGEYISSLIGLICVSGPFLIMSLCKVMGMGDVKLMAAVGLLLGYKGVLIATFFGIVIGCVAAIFMKVLNRKDWKSEIAFGPFLCAGTFLSMMFGRQLLSMYLTLLQ